MTRIQPADATVLLRAADILTARGLIEAHGHLSVRGAGATPGCTFVITPRRAPSLVDARDLVVLDGARPDSAGAARAALEWPLHAAIYKARPDVFAIARTHPSAVDAAGIRHDVLPVLHGRGSYVGEASVANLSAPVDTAERADHVARLLGGGGAVVLRGNGAVTVGRTMVEAAVRAIYLDETARLLLAGPLETVRTFSADEVAVRAGAPGDPYTRTWEYLDTVTPRRRGTSP